MTETTIFSLFQEIGQLTPMLLQQQLFVTTAQLVSVCKACSTVTSSRVTISRLEYLPSVLDFETQGNTQNFNWTFYWQKL